MTMGKHAFKLVALVSLLAGAVSVPAHGMIPEDHAYLWVTRDNGRETATAAVSPDGSVVFVTGTTDGSDGTDYATFAYSASHGSQLWEAHYDGSLNGSDKATSIAISPDGSRVYVTGSSEGTDSLPDYATVAYSASTGAQLWAARYNGPEDGYDSANGITVAHDGSLVVVTGRSWGGGDFLNADFATVAYSATTGEELWTTRYSGPGGTFDEAIAVAMSPDSSTVFVTGRRQLGSAQASEYVTISYSASNGLQLWSTTYRTPGNSYNAPASLAVSPDGSKVFVSGTTGNLGVTLAYAPFRSATLAYSATTGEQFWVTGFDDPLDAARALAVSPDGSRVFVTGTHSTAGLITEFGTIAYSTATGQRLWAAHYDDPVRGLASSIAVSPDGSKVFVTGGSGGEGTVPRYCPLAGVECTAVLDSDYATLAYSALTGTRIWVGRYNGPGNGDDAATSIVVSPDGSKVFVVGSSWGSDQRFDYATIAYPSGG